MEWHFGHYHGVVLVRRSTLLISALAIRCHACKLSNLGFCRKWVAVFCTLTMTQLGKHIVIHVSSMLIGCILPLLWLSITSYTGSGCVPLLDIEMSSHVSHHSPSSAFFPH